MMRDGRLAFWVKSISLALLSVFIRRLSCSSLVYTKSKYHQCVFNSNELYQAYQRSNVVFTRNLSGGKDSALQQYNHNPKESKQTYCCNTQTI